MTEEPSEAAVATSEINVIDTLTAVRKRPDRCEGTGKWCVSLEERLLLAYLKTPEGRRKLSEQEDPRHFVKLRRSTMGVMIEPAHYERVKELCRQIHQDTKFLSSIAVDHQAYREIVDMGEAAVPALLRCLDDFEDADGMAIWEPIAALYALTEADPVPQKDAGRLDRLLEHWLDWGRQQGIEWGGSHV